MADQDGNVAVALATMSGEYLATFHVQPHYAAVSIKCKVRERFGYPRDSQQLLLHGDILKDVDDLEALHDLWLTLVLLPFNKTTALRYSASRGHEAAVRNLLGLVAHDDEERSALVQNDQGGVTVLRVAACNGHASVCEALLEASQSEEERGNMLAAKDVGGRTALHFAAREGHEETCRVLLAAAPSTEVGESMLLATNGVDWTALHFSADCGHGTICQALLEAAPSQEVQNAMLAARDDKGKTAAQLASDEACRLLLEDAS